MSFKKLAGGFEPLDTGFANQRDATPLPSLLTSKQLQITSN